MKTFETRLATKDINATIRELKKARTQYEKKMRKEFFALCCERIISYANANLASYPIGDNVKADILSGWNYKTTITENGVLLSNQADKAAYVEFGVGIVAEGSPHPLADEVGYEYNVPSNAKTKSSTYSNGEKQFEEGTWIFYQNEADLDLPPSALEERTIFNEPERQRQRMHIRTRGTEPTMFLFKAVLQFVSSHDAEAIWQSVKDKYWS